MATAKKAKVTATVETKKAAPPPQAGRRCSEEVGDRRRTQSAQGDAQGETRCRAHA